MDKQEKEAIQSEERLHMLNEIIFESWHKKDLIESY